jgi:hypothetical protein
MLLSLKTFFRFLFKYFDLDLGKFDLFLSRYQLFLKLLRILLVDFTQDKLPKHYRSVVHCDDVVLVACENRKAVVHYLNKIRTHSRQKVVNKKKNAVKRRKRLSKRTNYYQQKKRLLDLRRKSEVYSSLVESSDAPLEYKQTVREVVKDVQLTVMKRLVKKRVLRRSGKDSSYRRRQERRKGKHIEYERKQNMLEEESYEFKGLFDSDAEEVEVSADFYYFITGIHSANSSTDNESFTGYDSEY